MISPSMKIIQSIQRKKLFPMSITENNTNQYDDDEMPLGTNTEGIIYIVYCKKKKKFDKYIKSIGDKLVIDINRSWSREEGPEFTGSMTFKVMIWRKMTIALDKGKHIYYIPNMEDNRSTPSKHLEMKKLFNGDIKFRALVFGYENLDYSGFDKIELID